MVSAQVISRATVDFYNDLSHHASKLMTVVEESQIYKSNQLATFEKMFKVNQVPAGFWQRYIDNT